MSSLPIVVSRVSATLQLLRPLNLFLSAVGVAVGAHLSQIEVPLEGDRFGPVILAMISAVLIAAASNAINDALDVEIDRINRPHRPIPSGRATRRTAFILAGLTASAGFVVSFFISTLHVILALAIIAAGFSYSIRLKKYGITGNIVVSVVVATSLIYGALAVGAIGHAWIGFIAAFLLTLAREIVKDFEDMEGDRVAEVRSLPLAGLASSARNLMIGLAAITVVLSPAPYLHYGFSGLYLFFVAMANVVLILTVWSLYSSPDVSAKSSRVSLLLKSAMALGMLALVFA